MSYSIWLEVDTGGPEPVRFGDWNCTSNLAPMWCEAGADLAEFHHRGAGECAPVLRSAIAELVADPKRFRAMDPPNGWGSYRQLVPHLVTLAEMFEAHPAATVVVWK